LILIHGDETGCVDCHTRGFQIETRGERVATRRSNQDIKPFKDLRKKKVIFF
jgi:CxxC motif-containing protein (DUF1111 family)